MYSLFCTKNIFISCLIGLNSVIVSSLLCESECAHRLNDFGLVDWTGWAKIVLKIVQDKLDFVRKEIEMENRTHTDVVNFLHKKRKYLGEKGERLRSLPLILV